MDESLLKLAKKLFHEALERPPDERMSFLDACCDDAQVRRQVESLLRWDRDAASAFLQGPGLDLDAGPDAASARMVGRRVAGFTIERPIASGGMGSVYVATQDRPRRSVALKLMRAGVASASALRRFEREAQVLGTLRHPHVAQVYEAGTYDDGAGGAPYFAMEYVPQARSITTFADERGLGLRERLALLAKVCAAVHHGHENGVIHRDLKPSNILVDAAGDPKVIDFGVAKTTDSDRAVSTLRTDVGELVGTLQYMSPEQCAGDGGDLDARSDVYAIGVVLYELLLGDLPYDVSRVPLPVAARVIQEEPPTRPSTVSRTLRGDVEMIALKALAKDRAHRYASAAALGADVERYLRGDAIEARRPSALYRARTLARRHRVASAVIALLLMVGPALAVVTTVAMRSSARARALNDLLADPNASPRATGRSWSGIERGVDEAVGLFMRDHGIPGATVAISKNGRLVHSKGYGLADARRGIRMEPWHRTRIGAVGNTLMITPALLRVLESRSDMDLDAPVYGPGGVFEREPFLADIGIKVGQLPPDERDRQRAWYRAMTLRHLVTGASGFGWQTDAEDRYGEPEPGETFRDIHRKALRERTLSHEPGQNVQRFGHQRALTGLALATLSGMPYVTYVEEHVLEPLGLRGVVVPEGTVVDERDALPHGYALGSGEPVPEIRKVPSPSPYSADGGWVASARDLVRLMVAMDGVETPPDLLSPAALEEMRRPASALPKNPQMWRPSRDYRRTAAFWAKTNSTGHRKYQRASGMLGGASFVAMFPGGYASDSGDDVSHVTIAVCLNTSLKPHSFSRDLADRLATLVGEASIPVSFDIWKDEAAFLPAETRSTN